MVKFENSGKCSIRQSPPHIYFNSHSLQGWRLFTSDKFAATCDIFIISSNESFRMFISVCNEGMREQK